MMGEAEKGTRIIEDHWDRIQQEGRSSHDMSGKLRLLLILQDPIWDLWQGCSKVQF